MKSMKPLFLFVVVVFAALAGCSWRPVNDTTRHFILTPITADGVLPQAAGDLSVGIGAVKMPGYLLHDSLAVRTGTNEIEYFERAFWADRLDHGFQQALGVDLSRWLGTDKVYLTDWVRDQMTVCVFVNVLQFDVDSTGCGTLIARWRIVAPDGGKPLKSGVSKISQGGSPPRGHPEVVAATLSTLTGTFSHELAQAIEEIGKSAR